MSKEPDDYKNQTRLLDVMICLVLIPFVCIARGVAIKYLWAWFLTPVFAVPAPNICLCLGLCLLADYLVFPCRFDDQERYPPYTLFCAIMESLCVLGVGWVISWCL